MTEKNTIKKLRLVKILTSYEGDKRINPKWHYVKEYAGGYATLCEGEYFGEGESACIYKIKIVERGITCPDCIAFIKELKAIKL